MISFPKDLTDVIISRLKMFVIMSDVIIEDISESYNQIGFIEENQSNAFGINDKLSILIEAQNNQYDSIINNNSARDLFLNLSKTFNNDLFIGYILSREEYEGSNKFSYSKNGKTGTYIIETTDISFFNEIYVGFYF